VIFSHVLYQLSYLGTVEPVRLRGSEVLPRMPPGVKHRAMDQPRLRKLREMRGKVPLGEAGDPLQEQEAGPLARRESCQDRKTGGIVDPPSRFASCSKGVAFISNPPPSSFRMGAG
jgi:hypothetical protein